jgi:glutamate dehydrogenase
MLTRASMTKAELVAEACERLRQSAPAGTADVFANLLFSHASAEDIASYSAAHLASITTSAWTRLQQRAVGEHRITMLQSGADPDLRSLPEPVTIIEIANDDMPFLLDSVLGELTAADCEIRLVLHPILTVQRQVDGTLDHLVDRATEGKKAHGQRESLIHIQVKQLSDTAAAALKDALDATLWDVRRAVSDWKPMLACLDDAIDDLKDALKKRDTDHNSDVVDFLKWLRDDNFTFLGMRTYATANEGDHITLERVPQSGLGLLADPNTHALSRGIGDLNASAAVVAFLNSTRIVTITKSSLTSRVHRRVPMDYIGLKLFSKKGKLTGELRIVGLFTSTAYTRPVRTIPHVRRKIDSIIQRAGFDPHSHSGKALINVLESHPRDDLFQIDEDTLLDFSTRILALDEHPRLRVLARRDQYDRFVSILVYLPRDRYTTDLRIRIGDYLAKAFDGEVTGFQPGFPEGSLTRVHFIVGRSAGVTPDVSEAELEEAVAALVRTWTDRLVSELAATHSGSAVETQIARYRSAFSGAYREAYNARTAVSDIAVINRMTGRTHDVANGPAVEFYRQSGSAPTALGLKLYQLDAPIQLSVRVPVLENMGLRVIDERTYSITPKDLPSVYLHDMSLEAANGVGFNFDRPLDERLEALFLAVWTNRAENDGFNVLGLTAGLDWREIALLRAYARYLRQVGIAYSQDYMWGTMARYPAIAATLVDLFATRFDPDFAGDREEAEATQREVVESELAAVTSLDDDQILRRFVNAITSTLRTNWYRPGDDGCPCDTVAFKIESRKVLAMPDPKPLREIWVYSARVEGIHTRFGKVARGGLRWSDRAQDFRTEVLGLVKAQQVKNAVIVPVGAKGGFLPKWLKSTMPRDVWFKEGTSAYEIFIASLLSVTDNLDGETVVPPPRVIRHEGDDPYLVVAADKGTATFSDNANSIAEKAGFWLGDAFASGGSAGYDHKKMGITARGAFEAVKRHFREMDVDIMATPFSVVGVGDMSGDVFGNGMLLAPTIRLIAAFDHRDIFIDPDPDMAASLAERQRLFDLPRSSWQDYNKSLISAGGGIFPRSQKSIELSLEAQAAIGLAQPHATPIEIMRAILKSQIDLLWFGGIGTYIRAMTETNLDAGDRANDAIRISAADVRAKVIGEGANLGVTQRARIEFNLLGGRCNSDAIDNSAGVNCSDIEVNIKIAFGNAIRMGLVERADRDALLAEMTADVAQVILRNNYLQTLAISVARRRGLDEFNQQRRLINTLEKAGRLDRTVEILPDEAGLDARAKATTFLSRAEIGVLLAYAKLTTKEDLVASDVPDDAYLDAMLIDYFPALMRDRFAPAIHAHRLKREIVATTLTNAMIDHGGPTVVTRVAGQTGADVAAIARAFVVARAIFGLDRLFADLDALDTTIAGTLQLDLYVRVQELLIGAMIWLTRNVSFTAGISEVIDRLSASVAILVPDLPALLPASLTEGPQAEIQRLTGAGVPEDLAIRLAHLPIEAAIGDIVLISETSGKELTLSAESYFTVAERFRIAKLERLGHAIAVVDYYEGLALDRARGQLGDAHRAIARLALAVPGGLHAWEATKSGDVDRALAQITELTATEKLTVSRFAVAAGLISDLSRE